MSKESSPPGAQASAAPIAWYPLLSEFLGTSLLITGGLGGVGLASAGLIPKIAAFSVVPGLTILTLVYAFSDLSGAHFNPAITLSFALRGSFAWSKLPGYWAAQLLGALTFGGLLSLALNIPPLVEKVSAGGSFWLETATTAFLTLVILAAAKRKAEVGTSSGIVVAGTLALCLLLAGPFSGVTLNTALALGQTVFGGSQHAWAHLLGPLLGALLATGLTWVLRGGVDGDEASAAKGDQNSGNEDS